MEDYEHDIAISFAGEDTALASHLVRLLEAEGLSIFFANAQQVELLGERLEEVLSRKYSIGSRFVAVLVSEHYSAKDWARFELGVARDEEKRRGEPFILPLVLAEARMVEIRDDKVFLDLRSLPLEDAVRTLVEKVQRHRRERFPQDLLDAALREWKIDGHLPTSTKVDAFWKDVELLDLDVDRCELLLRSPSSDGAAMKRGLRKIEPRILATAAERLVTAAAAPNLALAAIGYLGVADPSRAEQHLWRIYQNERLPVYDRARAFELFWLCPSERCQEEVGEVLQDETQPWPLRRAAVTNVLWTELNDHTEERLCAGLADPRQEVRSEATNAVLRFRLESPVPALISAFFRSRSRKGKEQIKGALRHFNHREDVVGFGRRQRFTRAFFDPPRYLHNWEESRPGWV